MNERDVRTALRDALKDISPGKVKEGDDIPGNLLQIVDSVGFIQLILVVEEKLGIRADLTTVDLGTLLQSEKLVSFLQAQA